MIHKTSLIHYVILACFLVACKTKQASIKPGKTDTSETKISFQQKEIYRFNHNGIAFSNRFNGARLNSISQQDDSTFTIGIKSENAPINPSPWYAFKIWSEHSHTLYITLDYEGTTHRYNPKVYQGKQWMDISEVKLSGNKKQVAFKVKVAADTLLVAAQELISTTDNYRWEDSLARLSFIKKQQIGKSLLKKPINALSIGENGKKLIVVLSRQHPPEVTGYMAMQAFIREVSSNTSLAIRFRKNYQLIVIPLINPDGVDEGNWRHSAAGVDLNRDWENFVQPETRAVRDFLLTKTEKQGARVYFGIDFHSTYYDVFYTNEDQPNNQTNIPGFTTKWLNAFSTLIPDFKPNIKPSPNGGNVSKSWMGRVLHAEALTYEVGDDTSRPLLKLKGKVAAEKMMELLLAEK